MVRAEQVEVEVGHEVAWKIHCPQLMFVAAATAATAAVVDAAAALIAGGAGGWRGETRCDALSAADGSAGWRRDLCRAGGRSLRRRSMKIRTIKIKSPSVINKAKQTTC